MDFIRLTFDVLVLLVLVLASITDIKTRIVPPKYQYALAGVTAAHLAFLFIAKQTGEAIWCLATGALVFAVYIGVFLVFKTGIGGADTKVTSLMAAYLGWPQTIWFILAHAGVVLGYAAFKKIAKKENVKSVPLMPFLAAGYVITRAIWWILHLV